EADRFFGILGVHVAGAPGIVALSAVDGGDGTLCPSQAKELVISVTPWGPRWGAFLRALACRRALTQQDLNFTAFASPGDLCRRPAVGDDLEKSHAAQDAEHLTLRPLRVCVSNFGDFLAADYNLEFRLSREDRGCVIGRQI